MNTLLLIQSIVFLSYVGFIIRKYGVLESISDSWYSLPQSLNFLFTLFTWGIGIPILFYGNVWFFLAGIGLSFVGAATRFKSLFSFTKQVHYTGAVIGIFSTLIGITVMYKTFIPLVTFTSIALLLQVFKIRNTIWWQEIVAFVTILGSMILLS